MFTCGTHHLHTDTCRGPHPHRTAAQVRADHHAAVSRARRSGFAQEPLPRWLYELLDPTVLRDRWEAVA
jgi:hypothetical protein